GGIRDFHVTGVQTCALPIYARAGIPHCPACGEVISRQTPQQIVDQILEGEEGARFQVLAPVVRTRKGEFVDLFAQLAADGYSRVIAGAACRAVAVTYAVGTA